MDCIPFKNNVKTFIYMINIKTYTKPKKNNTSTTTVQSSGRSVSSSSSTNTTDNILAEHFYYDAENDLVICRNGFATAKLLTDLQTQIDELKTQVQQVSSSWNDYRLFVDSLSNYVSVLPHKVMIDGDLDVTGVITHN